MQALLLASSSSSAQNRQLASQLLHRLMPSSEPIEVRGLEVPSLASPGCAKCLPSAKCRAAVKNWALSNGRGFWVGHAAGLKHLTSRLPALLRCVDASTTLTLVDVGAGMHSMPSNLSFDPLRDGGAFADDSDSLLLLGGFRERATVHAFEINQGKADQLVASARARATTREHLGRYHVHAMGVADEITASRVAQCGAAPNTWRLRSDASAGCRRGAAVNVTTLDAFSQAVSPPFYVKVDVEGGEMAVLRGMSRLLASGQVQLASFEYANGWHPAYNRRGPVEAAERAQIRETLRAFQERLDAYGYDTYLVHAVRKRHPFRIAVSLVPVGGEFWDDAFEICFDRALVYGRIGETGYGSHCWNDVVVVRRCNECVKRVLMEQVEAPFRGECDCV